VTVGEPLPAHSATAKQPTPTEVAPSVATIEPPKSADAVPAGGAGLIGDLPKPVETPAPPPSNPPVAVITPPPVAAVDPKPQPAPEPPPVSEKPAPPKRDLPPSMTNSIGLKLALIKPGHFMMGDEKLPDAPPHEVTLTQPFYMAVCELTNGELKKLVPQDLQPPGSAQPDDLPAAFISYEQAVDLCRRLSDLPEEKTAGRTYRLPTEAEWEYACRAGTTTRFAFGNTLTSEQANFGKKIDLSVLRRGGENPPERPAPPSGGPNGQRPNRMDRPGQPGGQGGPGGGPNPQQDRQQRPFDRVGSFTPNAWGLHDMHGSVWEWCSDFYAADYYKKSPSEDPTGPETGKTHVARGGAWNSPMAFVASAYRNAKAEPEQRIPAYGLRVVCEVQPQN
jgi:formylglycine-generating enzyme required for sulfatase activity